MFRLLIAGLLLTGVSTALVPRDAQSQDLTMRAVNEAGWRTVDPAATSPVTLKLQVLLDRVHASPGVIDGKMGTNTRRAMAAYRELIGKRPDEKMDEQIWETLTSQDSEQVLTTYRVTEKDIAGPFIDKLPDDFQEMATLKHLGYLNVLELLSEKFHMAEQLLLDLNPGAEFDKAGTEIIVADVARKQLPKIARLEVRNQQVRAFDGEDRIIAIYPATIGSNERPSPTGEFEVTAIAKNPKFYYDPALNLANVTAQEKLVLPPGPNNPVGAIWISISAEGYGIHGTPHPEEVGKTASHGCIRLTNWDALELGQHVSKSTSVIIASGN